MSITIGIYDLFAYTVPGLFFLFVVLRFINLLNIIDLDLSQFDNFYVVAIIVVSAYLSGHILDGIRDLLWKLIAHKLLKRPSTSEIVLLEEKEKHPGQNIQFKSSEAIYLLSSLRLKCPEISQYIDKLQADALMLRNVGFGFLLFAVVQFFYCIRDEFQSMSIGLLVGAVILSILTYYKGYVFHRNFYVVIYQASINYGNNLSMVTKVLNQTPGK